MSLNLQDSLLVNNGTVTGTTNVGYGATVTGSGAFGLVDLAYGGTLDLISLNANVSALTGDETVNGGTGSSSLSVGSGAFAGTIENTGGTLALLKIGSGQLILSGVGTYGGGTTVTGGTLAVTNANSLGDQWPAIDRPGNAGGRCQLRGQPEHKPDRSSRDDPGRPLVHL